MTMKLAKKWHFWGFDIYAIMGDLSFSLVVVPALFRHLEGPKEMHKQTCMVISCSLPLSRSVDVILC